MNPPLDLKRGSAMKTINKIITTIEEYVLAYSVIFMAILLIANIIMRKVFNQSMTFSEEVGPSSSMLWTTSRRRS